ncbi:GlxA family transcriptional regulator [Demequina zhanjiangensis]|uniref:DJ-1/PfpI family protein n=1 Tax=Demequina zhanjiangensis TaxID=3051659 RepID=A0ABT8FXK7_9MICO|nr:helix-turn-helix domain-containing protein [Demequina sp. SYSU T00b26]MDN4471638.1 DJ-1/PfpI family protein [Demequina sp. SYSU T00b26]
MRHRRIVLAVFDGVQGLDVFGPADVFYFANYLAEQAGEEVMPYTVEIVAAQAGPVRTASGPAIVADRALDDPDLWPDVLLVAGGLEVIPAAFDRSFVDAVADLARRSEEVGSVCTGALVLAEAGLLKGRTATTHWALAEMLTTTHPEISVDSDRLYAHDGVWTSAGVTAGIDLALQLLRTHHGASMAAAAARHLVVYLQRAGGQMQYSTHLAAQRTDSVTLNDLLVHIADNLQSDLTIRALAERAVMSERSLHRLFTAELGTTPARHVERVRVDAARRMLEMTDDPLSRIAQLVGFGNPETLQRAFKRLVGVPAGEYRGRFELQRSR